MLPTAHWSQVSNPDSSPRIAKTNWVWDVGHVLCWENQSYLQLETEWLKCWVIGYLKLCQETLIAIIHEHAGYSCWGLISWLNRKGSIPKNFLSIPTPRSPFAGRTQICKTGLYLVDVFCEILRDGIIVSALQDQAWSRGRETSPHHEQILL